MRNAANATLAMACASAALEAVSRRVAVVGGGSAGVAAARFLRRAGHRPTLFEAGDSFGGVWADGPTNDVVYKNLRTNLPTVVMQSPDLDFPAGLPSYVDAKALGDYIDAYAKAFGVDGDARLGARVDRVAPAGDKWAVAWTEKGAAEDDVFDAVVVANGHYDEPFVPELPGQEAWLAGGSDRAVVHSKAYDEPAPFAGHAVLVVGGRSSGVDLARELKDVAAWVYVLEKGCADAAVHEDLRVTHVPLGTSLHEDGRLRFRDQIIPGPAVDRVVLATGYVYAFPFLDEEEVDMTFLHRRSCRPLYLHLQHATRPTLGFVGLQLAVPCPIPLFEAQARYLAAAFARPDAALTPEAERVAWVRERLDVVAARGREQDLHYTASDGSAWAYMRRLVDAAPAADAAPTWLDAETFDRRLSTVESVYRDRAARYPTKPWHDDAYRRCEYAVDWGTGAWTVDDSRC